MNQHRFVFARLLNDDTCVGHMDVWMKKKVSDDTAMDAVKAALTQWIATTDDGRKAYGDYEEFNFGDFLNSSPWEDKSFMTIARKHGIAKIRGESLVTSDCVEDWDARLVDHEEIKVGWAEQGITE